jgi:hypothetical protein
MNATDESILVVFQDRPHSLLYKALCFEADDRTAALAAYAALDLEKRPMLYRAQLITPTQLIDQPAQAVTK